jgi:hypothetical protein
MFGSTEVPAVPVGNIWVEVPAADEVIPCPKLPNQFGKLAKVLCQLLAQLK